MKSLDANKDTVLIHLGIFHEAIYHLLNVIDHLPCDGKKIVAIDEAAENILLMAKNIIKKL